MGDSVCGPGDWNISSIFCDANLVPVLPSCVQNLVLSTSPVLPVLLALLQLGGLAKNRKIKVIYFKIIYIAL
jgi:hypothetical protein